MNIVPASQNNFSAALALLKENRLPTEDLSETSRIFVLEEGRDVVGTIAIEYDGDCGLLRSLSVADTYRNSGFGKALVSFIENFAAMQGVKNIFLLTTTAEHFFSKNGYAVIGRPDVPEFIRQTKEFSSICPSTAVAMKKILA